MKRVLFLSIAIALFITGLAACSNDKEAAHIGVNAEILEINTELKGFVVKSLDKNSILGDKCYVSCENPEIYYIHADNQTKEVQTLAYEDFAVGDEITVDVESVENKYTLTYRVQLLTQRL